MEIIKKILIAILVAILVFLVCNQFFSTGKLKGSSDFQAGNAGKGNAEEICQQAFKYLEGADGYPQNDNSAAKLFRESAEGGNAMAQYCLAVCYAQGRGVDIDYGQTIYWLEKAASNGHSGAKEFLKEFKSKGGFETPPDLEEVTEAAEKGDAEAQCKLAMFYYFGQGVPKDYTKMIFWLEKSAAQGFAEAQFRLGTGYMNGTGVPKDEKKAAELFAKSAEQGYAYGQYSLAHCYAEGDGVPKDEEQAVKWYTLAAEQGEKDAMYNLAALLHEKDQAKELYWLSKAAEQGDIDPATGYYLALHCLEGDGIPKDIEKAIKLLENAAFRKNTAAALKLSQLYFTGESVPEDYFNAVFWCSMAAEDGDPDAAAILEMLSKDPRYNETMKIINDTKAQILNER